MKKFIKGSTFSLAIFVVAVSLFPIDESRAEDFILKRVSSLVFVSLMMDGGSCSELLSGIKSFYQLKEKVKLKREKIDEREFILSFCRRVGVNDDLCADIADRGIKKDKKGEDDTMAWLLHSFSNKKLSVKQLEQFISRMEQDIEQEIVKEAKKVGKGYKDKLLEMSLNQIEIMMLVQLHKIYQCRLSNIFYQYSDYILDMVERNNFSIDREKLVTRELMVECRDSQENRKLDLHAMLNSKIKYLTETYKIPVNKIKKQICAGKNQFLCQAYKDTL